VKDPVDAVPLDAVHQDRQVGEASLLVHVASAPPGQRPLEGRDIEYDGFLPVVDEELREAGPDEARPACDQCSHEMPCESVVGRQPPGTGFSCNPVPGGTAYGYFILQPVCSQGTETSFAGIIVAGPSKA